MYRTILPILVYASIGYSAPKDSSEVTYVKIQTIQPEGTQATGTSSIREPGIEGSSLTAENDRDNVRNVRSDDTTPFYEETTATTDTATTYEEEAKVTTPHDALEIKTKTPSARFYSKLSYFQKTTNEILEPLSTNLVDTKAGKRKYLSKCRCEKIWNCLKLQISVGRCPNEFFLCCF